MWKKFRYLLFIFFVSGTVYAQVGRSPYTINGIGDLQGMSLIHQDAMGGVGISNAKPWGLSNINPALLPVNSPMTNFEFGLVGERRVVQKDSLNQENGGVNINYLAFGFPIKPGRWTVSVGLMPYSRVNYDIVSTNDIIGSNDDVGLSFRGNGGINQAYLGTGVRLFKHLFIGARAGYLFGAINNEIVVNNFRYALNDSLFASTGYKTSYLEKTSFSDFYFGGGIAYELKLNSRTYLNFGAIYDLEADINAEKTEELERRNPNNEEILSSIILEKDKKGAVILPPKYGFGLSLQNGTRWNVATDVLFQDWSEYRGFGNQIEEMNQYFRWGLGVEFIPDFFSVRNYFERVAYKMGFSYERTPFLKNNQQVNDFGINFGASFPINNVNSISMFTLGFKYGQRGTNDNDLIKEDYYRISIGLSFNDRWFIRRKYD